MRILLLIFVCFCHSVLLGQNPWKNIYSEHAWAERDRWQKPEELIRLLEVAQGDAVADVGCHEGYMTFKLAKVVGDRGIVYAIDLDQNKLDKVKNLAEARSLKNIHTIKGTADDPKLPAEGVDAIIILDTYHEMDDHAEILRHLKASLRNEGRLLICEPISDERRDLSRKEQEAKHELTLRYALADLREAGFRIIFQQDNFIDRTREKGDRMWVVVAEKI